MRKVIEIREWSDGEYRLLVIEEDLDGNRCITDILEGNLRFVLSEQLKMFDPDTKLGIRKVKT